MLLRVLVLTIAVMTASAGCAHQPREGEAQVVRKEGVSRFFGSMQVHRYKLSNGLKVLILEDHSAPTFAYHTWFNVGSRNEEKGLTGLAHLFEHMMFKGTKNLKDGEFDRILEAAGAENENAFTSQDYTGYIQSLPADKLELIARLESERMVNLIINQDLLNTEREVVQNERRFRNENNPDGMLYEKLYEVAYTSHPYQWPVIGYAKDLAAASVAACQDFYKRFYAPNNATIVISGDVNPDKAMSIIEKYYASLPSSEIGRKPTQPEPQQKAERKLTVPVKTATEKVNVAYHIPSINQADAPVIEVARSLLGEGKSSRLYRRLVDTGIASSVSVGTTDSADPGLMLIFVTMQTGKQSKEALGIISEEIAKLRSGQVEPEEIEQAVTQYRFALFDILATNYMKAYMLGHYETVANRFERLVEIVNAMGSVDKQLLSKVAKTYFNDENRNVVIGVPLKGEAKQ